MQVLAGRCVLVASIVVLALGVTRPASAEDETQACDVDGQRIAYGDVKAGCSIEVVADVDITFAGVIGDDPRMIITRTIATGLRCAAIRRPDNSILVANVCGHLVLNRGVLPAAAHRRVSTHRDGGSQQSDVHV